MTDKTIRTDSRSKRLPSLEIPHLEGSPQLKRVIGQIKAILDTRFGKDGPLYERAVTWGDLFDRGVLGIRGPDGVLQKPPYNFNPSGDVPLLVNTRAIVPNAVTVPVSAEAAAAVVLNNTWQTLLTIPVDFGDVPPEAVFLIAVVNINFSAPGSFAVLYLRFTIDGVPFGQYDYGFAGQTIAATISRVDIGRAGPHVYTVEGFLNAGATYQAEDRAMLVLGTKR